ncbi:MAG: hypothetical protein KJZ54_00750 [Phycisphaerales bacterium]|nr:hypothetical protein [Phycisphaerales bacterium]
MHPRPPSHHDPTLLAEALAGDREAIATYLCRNAARIKRRYRARLPGPARRWLDPDDLVSIIGLHLDAYVLSGRLAVANEAQLWSLVFRIGDRVLARLSRQADLERRVVGAGVGPTASGCPARNPRPTLRHFTAARRPAETLRSIRRDEDRELLRLRLAGVPFDIIADQLGVSPAAARKRWQRLIATLRSDAGGGGGGRERGSRDCREVHPGSRSRWMVAPRAVRRSSRRS